MCKQADRADCKVVTMMAGPDRSRKFVLPRAISAESSTELRLYNWKMSNICHLAALEFRDSFSKFAVRIVDTTEFTLPRTKLRDYWRAFDRIALFQHFGKLYEGCMQKFLCRNPFQIYIPHFFNSLRCNLLHESQFAFDLKSVEVPVSSSQFRRLWTPLISVLGNSDSACVLSRSPQSPDNLQST